MYFIESIHKYYKNFPDENFKYISASSVAKRYSQEFDDVFWSLYKAYEFLLYKTDVDPNLHIDDYLLNKPKEPKDYFKPYKKGYIGTDYKLFKHLRMYADENEVKKVQSYILKSWDEKNKNSLIKGGKYHSNEEFNALQENFMINPFTGNSLPVIQCNEFINQDLKRLSIDLKDLKPGFYTELIVYSGMLLGQIDQLWVEEFNGGIVFWIGDHKTNEKMNMNNPYQKMKYPINHFDDCNYNHYRIQLGVYSYILEEYGYTCMGNRLMHSMYDEITDTWEIENYDFDYIRHEMNEIVMDITINI